MGCGHLPPEALLTTDVIEHRVSALDPATGFDADVTLGSVRLDLPGDASVFGVGQNGIGSEMHRAPPLRSSGARPTE